MNRTQRTGLVVASCLVVSLINSFAVAQPEPPPGPSSPPAPSPSSAPSAPPGSPGPGAATGPVVTAVGAPSPAVDPQAPVQPAADASLLKWLDAIKLGGYFQPAFVYVKNTSFNQDDQDGFVFRNARLLGTAEAKIDRHFTSEYVFNFDVGTGVFLVRDVFGSIVFHKGLVALDAGQMKTPFMLTELVAESDLQFPTTPIGVRRLAYGRDRGLRLRGEVAPGGVHLGWSTAFQNGEGSTAAVNSDSKFLYAGRVEIGPLGKTPLSEPDLENSAFRVVVGANAVHTPTIGRNELGLSDAGGKETRAGVDLRAHFRGASLRGEFITASVKPKSGAKFGRRGFYVQGGYVLPIPIKTQFEIVGRFEQLDLNDSTDGVTTSASSATDPELLFQGQGQKQFTVPDNSSVRRVEVGANAYILKHRLKMHVSYLRTDYLEGPKTDVKGNPLIGDTVQAQLQFGWF